MHFYVLPSLFILSLLADFLLIELQLSTFQNVSVASSDLSRTRSDARKNATNLDLLGNSGIDHLDKDKKKKKQNPVRTKHKREQIAKREEAQKTKPASWREQLSWRRQRR